MRKLLALLAWSAVAGALSGGLTDCCLDPPCRGPSGPGNGRFCDDNKVVTCACHELDPSAFRPSSCTEEMYMEELVEDCSVTRTRCVDDVVQGAHIVHCE
jgi:hypothetical protein